MVNSKAAVPRRQPQNRESHDFQFRGAWLPPRVFYLIRDGATATRKVNGRPVTYRAFLNATEIALLVVIDALTNPTGRGCYASNAYLGKQVGGIGPLPVSRAVKRLIDFGLIVSDGATSDRELRTSWSRAADPTIYSAGIERSIPAEYTNLNPTDLDLKTNRRLSRSADAERPHGDLEEEMLFSEGAKSPAAGYTAEDKRDAVRLHTACVAHHKTPAKKAWSPSAWAKHIARLQAEVGSGRLTAALEWYTAHIADEYAPQAWSAASFREKFSKIEAAMFRDRRRNPTVEVSSLAVRITDRLTRLGWPKGAKGQLPGAVQLSLNGAVEANDKIEAVASLSPLPSNHTLRLFADRLHRGMMPAPSTLVEKWFKDVHKRVRSWGEWSGNLIPGCVLTANHADFTAYGRGLAQKYCGDPSRWDELLKEADRVDQAG